MVTWHVAYFTYQDHVCAIYLLSFILILFVCHFGDIEITITNAGLFDSYHADRV